MTKRFDLYGSQSMSISEVAQALSAALDVSFALHDSSYRGGDYYRGKNQFIDEVIIQTNFKDEDGYLAEEEFSEYRTLAYVTCPDEATLARLETVPNLRLLRTELL